jgi:hypothetical protein
MSWATIVMKLFQLVTLLKPALGLIQTPARDLQLTNPFHPVPNIENDRNCISTLMYVTRAMVLN